MKYIRLFMVISVILLTSACFNSTVSKTSSSDNEVSSEIATMNSTTMERIEENPPIDAEHAKKLLSKQKDSQNNIKDRKKILSVTPQLQHVWNYCAPTTVSMMLSTQGKSVSQEQLAKEMGTYEPFGTHNRDAIRVLNQHLFGYSFPKEGEAGYRIETVTEVDEKTVQNFKKRLLKNIDDGYPMYYTFWSEKMYPGKKGEHNVIGIGYELSEDLKEVINVYYLDPSPNVQDATYGGLKKVSPEELLEVMLPCQEPNYAY